jgi:hypothetical protein
MWPCWWPFVLECSIAYKGEFVAASKDSRGVLWFSRRPGESTGTMLYDSTCSMPIEGKVLTGLGLSGSSPRVDHSSRRDSAIFSKLNGSD